MKKLLKKLILYTLIIAISVGGVVVYFGHKEYKEVIQTVPLNVAIDEIRQREDYVPLSEMNPIAPQAMVATEDDRLFERHAVLDFWAIGRATWRNITSFRLVEGGSTIPQQVAKNIYFDHSASFVRKISEYFVTRDLLNQYTKEEILELYLNIIYYGDGFYGIYQASEGYFNVFPNELNDGQATLLMGLPQAPSYYALSTNLEGAKKRQKHVLARMVEEKQLTRERADEIYEIDIEYK
ncbi:transglycosylase domain-containing protein [Erysipelothrix inopinata]|uniref:Transglycosylase domain-containing protein n=1 Tax=Erysipelothrix inopinata TaxID=225084 RepID=A0A7G9RYL9_9FIRM|nr:biosynthetic peptidoglycan transglycosylase [Erysipelothrix inopinata]QNN60694.1 transglycosylase domain-containing protein [Erysipelothrix inopinata]